MSATTQTAARAAAEVIRVETGLKANTPGRVGTLLKNMVDSVRFVANVTAYGASPAASAATNLAAIQAAIDAVRTIGWGRVFIPAGVYALTAPYRDTNDIYTGWVANDENRRANKALIVYDAENIEIVGESGTVLDRSANQIADTTYAEFSTTLYISKSRNITVRGIEFRGYQEDDELLDDVKNQTSGDGIQVNSGCDGILIEDCVVQDGTTGITIGLNRTAAEVSNDPALDPCTNVTIRRFEARNCEHGMVLCDLDGFVVDGFRARVYTREDASTGVCQRSLYLHSCRNGRLSGIHLTGAFKTSILVRDYAPVTNITVNGLTIADMMTPLAINSARGSALVTNSEGHGISMHAANCADVSFENFRITGVTTGVVWPGAGMRRVSFRKGYVDAVFVGMAYLSPLDSGATLLDNPIDGLSFDDIEIRQLEDGTNYPSITPNCGLYVDSTAVTSAPAAINAKNVNTRNVRVYARNRNARLLNADGFTTDCEFTRSTGLSGARTFDFNYSGVRYVRGTVCGNNLSPNKSQDVPTGALILGRLEWNGAGTPEGAVIAPVGSVATRTDGGASTTMYIKESGAGTNTGWIAK